MKSRVVRMDHQFSKAVSFLLVPPSFDFLEHFPCILAGVEFDSLWRHDQSIESIVIAGDSSLRFRGPYYMAFFAGNLSFGCQPDSCLIRREIEPRFILSQDGVPPAGFLALQHSQEL
jgi:hypothetical protein